jgi:hypothetical protein
MNIALTATASLLWCLSDAIQSKRKNLEEESQYSGLCMLLLLELLELCTDRSQGWHYPDLVEDSAAVWRDSEL